MKAIIKKILPNSTLETLKIIKYKFFADKYAIKSFGETGEDVLLYKLFHPKKAENKPVVFKKDGLYIDIGCNHPVSNSQTYGLYKRGWKGIVIDPLPDYRNLFQKVRPKDIYLPCGVSCNNGTMKYYMYDLNVINSFDKEASEDLAQQLNAKLLEVKEVPVVTIDEICKTHLKGRTIDFMSIDAEGYELEILKSNDWEKYRPKFILTEVHNWDFKSIDRFSVYSFLVSHKYKLINVIGHNCMFEDTLNANFSHF
jgi:FkbM family methyltransferase